MEYENRRVLGRVLAVEETFKISGHGRDYGTGIVNGVAETMPIDDTTAVIIDTSNPNSESHPIYESGSASDTGIDTDCQASGPTRDVHLPPADCPP
jgi:hypothetical protein